jgi:hypothetical protein
MLVQDRRFSPHDFLLMAFSTIALILIKELFSRECRPKRRGLDLPLEWVYDDAQ